MIPASESAPRKCYQFSDCLRRTSHTRRLRNSYELITQDWLVTLSKCQTCLSVLVFTVMWSKWGSMCNMLNTQCLGSAPDSVFVQKQRTFWHVWEGQGRGCGDAHHILVSYFPWAKEPSSGLSASHLSPPSWLSWAILLQSILLIFPILLWVSRQLDFVTPKAHVLETSPPLQQCWEVESLSHE